jgi:hypothetical protein
VPSPESTALRILRVLVRGRFDGLDEPSRARLLAEADRHSVADAAFTETGTLTYDRALSSFGFRVQLRVRGDGAEDRAIAHAEQAARAALDGLGVGCRDVRTTVSDMAAVWAREGGGSPGGTDAAVRR